MHIWYSRYESFFFFFFFYSHWYTSSLVVRHLLTYIFINPCSGGRFFSMLAWWAEEVNPFISIWLCFNLTPSTLCILRRTNNLSFKHHFQNMSFRIYRPANPTSRGRILVNMIKCQLVCISYLSAYTWMQIHAILHTREYVKLYACRL